MGQCAVDATGGAGSVPRVYGLTPGPGFVSGYEGIRVLSAFA